MDDAEYLFRQTERELKRTGYGARHRKCGSKSKSCKMPADYLTPAQKRKMNGDVKVYQLNKPMTWASFRAMPHDLQKQYIQNCVDNQGRKIDIADMMGCSIPAFDTYMSHHHRGEFSFAKGRHEISDVWLEWVTDPSEKAAEEEPAKEVATPAPTPAKKIVELTPATGTMTFCGEPEDVFIAVMRMLDRKKEYSITVNFTER